MTRFRTRIEKATLPNGRKRDCEHYDDVVDAEVLAEHKHGAPPDDVASGRGAADPLAELRASIQRDLDAPDEVIDSAEPPQFIVPGRLPVCGASLAGTGGTGKTTLSIVECVYVAASHELYDAPVERPGRCVLLSAEDGAAYGRYVLRRVLEDGVQCGALPESAAKAAKAGIRIVEWSRPRFGPIAHVDSFSGSAVRAAAFDTLVELLAKHQPAYVSLDPLALFGPGERFGNDVDSFVASMIHETALHLGAFVQAVDHVSQAVAMTGEVHQHAARGSTSKTDNARLARQVVKVRDANGTLPRSVTGEDMEAGRVLQVHWTKANYCALPPPAWLKRRGFWMQHVRPLSQDEARELRDHEAGMQRETDLQSVIGALAGGYLTQRDLEEVGVRDLGGEPLSRKRLRAALAFGRSQHRVVELPLPENERRTRRTHYLAATPAGDGQ